TTCTSSPRSSSARTTCEPMNPAPPVTIVRTGVVSYGRGVRHVRRARRLRQDDPGRAPAGGARGGRPGRRGDPRAGRDGAGGANPLAPAGRPGPVPVGGGGPLRSRARGARGAGDPAGARA